MGKYIQGYYTPVNKEKYAGDKLPIFRSSWEHTVMVTFDTNPHVISWASEPVRIPYRNPFTGKQTVYVPDFIVTYIDANGRQITELIEVKPSKETLVEEAKTKKNKAALQLNMYKWAAAKAFADHHNIGFRVMTEYNIYNNPKRKS